MRSGISGKVWRGIWLREVQKINYSSSRRVRYAIANAPSSYKARCVTVFHLTHPTNLGILFNWKSLIAWAIARLSRQAFSDNLFGSTMNHIIVYVSATTAVIKHPMKVHHHPVPGLKGVTSPASLINMTAPGATDFSKPLI